MGFECVDGNAERGPVNIYIYIGGSRQHQVKRHDFWVPNQNIGVPNVKILVLLQASPRDVNSAIVNKVIDKGRTSVRLPQKSGAGYCYEEARGRGAVRLSGGGVPTRADAGWKFVCILHFVMFDGFVFSRSFWTSTRSFLFDQKHAVIYHVQISLLVKPFYTAVQVVHLKEVRMAGRLYLADNNSGFVYEHVQGGQGSCY